MIRKPSRYQQHFWRLLLDYTHNHHLCGVWLWAFPSSSHLVAAAFCLSSESPLHPPSCPPSPLEWESTPRSWWYLKRVSQGILKGRPFQTGMITNAVTEKACLQSSSTLPYLFLAALKQKWKTVGTETAYQNGSWGGDDAMQKDLL